MKYSGPLGFPRLTGIGPLSAEDKNKSREEIKEIVEDVADDQGIDLDNLTESEIDTMHSELASELFSEPESSMFEDCMTSEWAVEWEKATGKIDSRKAEMVSKVDACYSAVIPNDSLNILPFAESSKICKACMSDKLD